MAHLKTGYPFRKMSVSVRLDGVLTSVVKDVFLSFAKIRKALPDFINVCLDEACQIVPPVLAAKPVTYSVRGLPPSTPPLQARSVANTAP